MKDNIFEMLLDLFEASLNQLQKKPKSDDLDALDDLSEEEHSVSEGQMLSLRLQHDESTRVLTYMEQLKLTKASYQFLMRMKLCDIVNSEFFELIMNQLYLSESRIVTLQETKWIGCSFR